MIFLKPGSASRVARWFIFMPKMPIMVYIPWMEGLGIKS
jgi:hypothetical protein